MRAILIVGLALGFFVGLVVNAHSSEHFGCWVDRTTGVMLECGDRQNGLEHEATGTFVVTPRPAGDTWRWDGSTWVTDLALVAAKSASERDDRAQKLLVLDLIRLLIQKGVITVNDLHPHIRALLP